VRITVRKDLVGTVFELGDILNGKPSPVFTQTGLKDYPNIDARMDLFSDTDHSKYFVVDDQLVILGGMNIADEYHAQWHDYMAAIRGQPWALAFSGKAIHGLAWPSDAPFVITVNDRQGTEIRTALIEMIDRAVHAIIIEHAYFSDDPIIAALLRAGQRGVQVTIILPETPDTHGWANQVTINRLLAADTGSAIAIYLYPRMSHAKVALADDTTVAVGSANLTPRSMLTSREIVLFARGRKEEPFIQQLRDQLAADLSASKRVTAPFKLSAGERIKALAGKYIW
jgi:phosphatidylserine/phosphatidylglycerophosphate/cardiolipin synthase-like enzyme